MRQMRLSPIRGGCEHHLEHTEDCGYTEGEVGAPCEHEHTKECYTLVKKCIHEHDESCYPVSEGSGLEETATPSEAEEMEPTSVPMSAQRRVAASQKN